MQLRLAPRVTRRRRLPDGVGPLSLINLNLAAGSLLALRQLAMRVCGDGLQFIRVDTCSETLRARVCLCVLQRARDDVIDAVRRQFPDAAITRLSATSLSPVSRHALQ